MIDIKLGRALGPGNLQRVQRGAGEPRWTLSWTDARGNRRKRALSTDRRVAERMRNSIISSRDLDLAGLGQIEGQSRALIEICNAYIADLRTHASASHIVNTQAALKRVLGLVDARRVCDLVVHDVLRVRAELLVEGLSRRTANLQVDRLSAALAWAVKAKLIAANPIAGITRLPETEAYQKRVRRSLTDDEIARVIAAAMEDDRRCEALLDRGGMSESLAGTPEETPSDRRVPQAPLFRFLLESGCRYGETRAMTWGDVDLDDCVVTLKAATTKARRSRCIPIRHEFAHELRRLRELHTRVLRRPPGAAGNVFLTPEGANGARRATTSAACSIACSNSRRSRGSTPKAARLICTRCAVRAHRRLREGASASRSPRSCLSTRRRR
ncbi:MAG: tyrosine-type recombinase/integrase [Sandaracinaceae bacterium]|nr:tyrosine-type recombinase/integrase [Sandaracinaceae bacterium]